MLLIYSADCPRCRELVPALDNADFGELSSKVAMVRHRNDQEADFMNDYARFGSYVPRIFIIDPEGKVREDLVSDHPRFPYFYPVHMMEKLKSNLRAVAK